MDNQNTLLTCCENTSPEYFTGTACVQTIVPRDETGNYSIRNVLLKPGCRNNWHKQTTGQILLVTNGKGYYQERDKPGRSLVTGDDIIISPGVEHWLGATHKTSFTYIVINNIHVDCIETWLEAVSDEEYNRVQVVLTGGKLN
jgi:4-carboxymuconolactone decarboxylase